MTNTCVSLALDKQNLCISLTFFQNESKIIHSNSHTSMATNNAVPQKKFKYHPKGRHGQHIRYHGYSGA